MSEVASVDPSTNVLSLCAGGGGLDLGLRRAVPDARTVCYVENEITACGVLAQSMADGGLDDAPVWTDLRTFNGTAWRGLVDCIIGGYPCQPFSNAGRRLGQDDPRHLWPEVARITAEVGPRLVFFENVGAHLRLGFYEVARSLQGMGYVVAATLLTASEVGAPHGRERLFILAHRSLDGRYEGRAAAREDVWGLSASRSGVADADLGSRGTEPREQHPQRAEVAVGAGSVGDSDITRLEGRDEPERGGGYELPAWETSAEVADAAGDGREGSGIPVRPGGSRQTSSFTDRSGDWPPGPTDTDAWARVIERSPGLAPALSIAEELALGVRYSFAAKKAQPPVRGVVDELARGLGRSDQLHILGNGVVPPQAAYAFALLAQELGL